MQGIASKAVAIFSTRVTDQAEGHVQDSDKGSGSLSGGWQFSEIDRTTCRCSPVSSGSVNEFKCVAVMFEESRKLLFLLMKSTVICKYTVHPLYVLMIKYHPLLREKILIQSPVPCR